MRRLLPSPADHVVVRECYDVDRPEPADRPWVELCMVASLDGTTVVEGRSHALSSPTDTQVLLTLRELFDLVLVGAGTVRAERYGPPKRPGQRIAVVSRSGKVDTTAPLFTSGAGFLVLPRNAPPTAVECVRAGDDELDLVEALAQIRDRFGVRRVHAEGGPNLNAALAAADVVDELNLTVSPQLAGGAGPRVLEGAPPLGRPMRLAHVLEHDGFLFTRWLTVR